MDELPSLEREPDVESALQTNEECLKNINAILAKINI